MRVAFVLAMLFGVLATDVAVAGDIGPNYADGNVTAITSNTTGIFIQLDGGTTFPINCTGNTSGWYLVAQANTSMISLFLSSYFSDHKTFRLFTDATSGTYCSVDQLWPTL